jgi:hypothetical protein
MEKYSIKTEVLQNDLEELETIIYPRYDKIASDTHTEISELETNYEKLITTADEYGEILHREVTSIVNQRKSDIQEMKTRHLYGLNKYTDEITDKMTELKQIIDDLKSILKSDIYLTCTYKSRNSECRTLPPKVHVTFPSFSPQKINKDQLQIMFGSLLRLPTNTECGHSKTSAEAISFPLVRPLLSEPMLTVEIDIKYRICSVRWAGED